MERQNHKWNIPMFNAYARHTTYVKKYEVNSESSTYDE